MNAANKGDPSRKSFREVLLAWQAFIRDEPDSLLYLHTEQIGLQGVPLAKLVQQLNLGESVRFVDAYRYATGQIPGEELNRVYNAADVLINTSRGEGFGIPILEAQAAGCPVIVTDFSAMPELCFAGWRVSGTLVMTYQNAMQMIPSIPEIVAALHEAKNHMADNSLREQARQAALDYDVRRVYAQYWQPLLNRIERGGMRLSA
ncbi:MAG TPA: glycosyltransferase, partial [Aggregatilineales bacterium]|nr:glycosyltransferase [Aggregatilineales bacterium]